MVRRIPPDESGEVSAAFRCSELKKASALYLLFSPVGGQMVVVGHEPASNPATTTFQLSDPGEVTSSPEAMVSSSANRNITIETEMLLLNFQNGCGD